MYHFFEAITNTSGDSLVGFRVALRTADNAVVPIYADQSGTPIAAVSRIDNVALTNSQGNVSLFVENGTYDILISGPDGTLYETIRQASFETGEQGEPGKDAPLAQVASGTTIAGQTRFPETGPILDIKGAEFNATISVVDVSLNGAIIAPGIDYTYDGGSAGIVFTSAQPAGVVVVVIGQPQIGGSAGGGAVGSDEVDVAGYPGTTISDDPDRLDHDNTRFKNAQLDVTDPDSPNFGKALRFRPLAGSGQLVLLKPDGSPVPQLTDANDPADPEMNARVGDWLLDSWSVNGIVPDDFPNSPIIPNLSDPGNWLSGVVIRASYQVRFRRPPRVTMRPFILCAEPIPTAESTDSTTGISTQSDVFVGNRVEGYPAFIGENHWRGYSQQANDIQISGSTDLYVEARSFGCRSDLLYNGATSLGGGTRNAHNKRTEYHLIADGYNMNNRNVFTGIDLDGEKGTIWARRFSKPGGPDANDDMDPYTGVGAPGVHDSEPNASFTDDPIYRNSDVTIYAEDCGSPGALFLPENGSFPNPCQNFKRRVTHFRCLHGFISQTKANPVVPYGIDVEVWTDKSDRAIEVLSGGGKFVVHATDCPKASFVGYFGLSAGDLHVSGEMIRCGTASGVVIENRGWDGGSRKGLRILGADNLIGIRHIPGGVTRGLTLDGNEFGAGMAFAEYVDIGADVRAGTINERGTQYNGNVNLRWNAPGTPLKSIPTDGSFVAGQEWPTFAGLEPGSPRIIRSVATNTSGAPVMIQQEQIAGFVDPVGYNLAGAGGSATNMVEEKPGLLRATAANARRVLPSAGAGNFTFRAPFSGSQTVYVGFANTDAPTSAANLIVGLWFGDTTGGVLGKAVAIASGGPAGSRTYKYGDEATVSFRGNGFGNSISVTLNGETFYSSGSGAATAFPCILIMTAGERVLITGV